MSGTGTIQSAAPQVITDITNDALQVSFVNTSGGALVSGQEVTIKTNGEVDKRDAGTELPHGIVIVGGANNARVTVRLFGQAIINAIIKLAGANAGALVKPNGTIDATGVPQYVATTDGDYVSGYVIKGGLVDTAVKVLILNSFYQLNPAPGS